MANASKRDKIKGNPPPTRRIQVKMLIIGVGIGVVIPSALNCRGINMFEIPCTMVIELWNTISSYIPV
jgi:hypothetical protein